MEGSRPTGISRRDALKLGAATAGAAALAPMAGTLVAQAATVAAPTDLNEVTVAQLSAAMAAGQLHSLDLVNFYLQRIQTLDQGGPRVNSVIEVNPDAKSIAMTLDAERKAGRVRGPLHGIPVLLKDNIDTGDRMQTAAGSFGLVGSPASQDSTVVANLRAGGAVILGKTTLSEWANFRSFFASSGWSGRGGQCNNPYALDRNPCGSSSGSGAATSANFTAVSVGTETDGSVICPGALNGVVGIKPTVGLVSRGGIVPISHTQDTAGPHGRTVADVAVLLTAMAQRKPDKRDPATFTNRSLIPADYTAFLNPRGLQGARIGVDTDFLGISPHVDVVIDSVLTAMQNAGATLINVSFPHIADINSGANELTVLLYDFKGDLQKYFATRPAGSVPLAQGTLQTAIDFNSANAATEMPFFGQEIFLLAETFNITDPNAPQTSFAGISYNQALANDRLFGATEGIDLLFAQNNLDAIMAPVTIPAWPTDLINGDRPSFGSTSPAAIVGYPNITVPAGFSFGLPVGASFFGPAFTEPKLITIASGFEAVVQARQAPQFLATLPFNTKGMPTSTHRRRPFETRIAPSNL